jgi:hypothetical protein
MMMLFKVTLRGMTIGPNAYGISYVVAECPTSAYKKVKEFLDTNDLGFSRDRELHSIELIADSYRHTTGTLLHI